MILALVAVSVQAYPAEEEPAAPVEIVRKIQNIAPKYRGKFKMIIRDRDLLL